MTTYMNDRYILRIEERLRNHSIRQNVRQKVSDAIRDKVKHYESISLLYDLSIKCKECISTDDINRYIKLSPFKFRSHILLAIYIVTLDYAFCIDNIFLEDYV